MTLMAFKCIFYGTQANFPERKKNLDILFCLQEVPSNLFGQAYSRA